MKASDILDNIQTISDELSVQAIDSRRAILKALGASKSDLSMITAKTVIILPVELEGRLKKHSPEFVHFSPLVASNQVLIT